MKQIYKKIFFSTIIFILFWILCDSFIKSNSSKQKILGLIVFVPFFAIPLTGILGDRMKPSLRNEFPILILVGFLSVLPYYLIINHHSLTSIWTFYFHLFWISTFFGIGFITAICYWILLEVADYRLTFLKIYTASSIASAILVFLIYYFGKNQIPIPIYLSLFILLISPSILFTFFLGLL